MTSQTEQWCRESLRLRAFLEDAEEYNYVAEIAAQSDTVDCARPGRCAISHLPGHCVSTGDRP